MIKFGFYDSEDQDWHVIPVVALEQEICLVYMQQDPVKKDCTQQGCMRSRTLHLVVLCSPKGGERALLLVVGTPQESLYMSSQPGLTRALQISQDLELNAACVEIQKCSPSTASSAPSRLFCFSSTIHSSHLTEKLSMSTWLLSFMHCYYMFCVIILYHCWPCTTDTIPQWGTTYCAPFFGTARSLDCQKHVFSSSTIFLQRKVIFKLQKNHSFPGHALYNKAISCA